MQEFLQTQEEYVLISHYTPLLSNLDMNENIALIKEVHENMRVLDAEALAEKLLGVVGLASIAKERVESCSREEIFLVMFIRALMSQEKNVIIELPTTALGTLQNICEIIEKMLDVNHEKKIIILDIQSNKIHYEGCRCHIIK